MKRLINSLLLTAALCSINLPAAAEIDYLRQLQQRGMQPAPVAGEQLWRAKHGDRSCTSCHAQNPRQTGKHAKTGKTIEPMAPSVNPGRYQDSRKINKWFLRNCKWTLGRTCSDQEKADILAWLQSQ